MEEGTGTLGRARRDGGSIEDFVVITGFSGAGKSQAMACFEDAGYFCVDNLPPEMILSLADLFQHEGSKVERAAVVSDVRGGDYFEGFVKVLDDLERARHRVPAAVPRRVRARSWSTATRRRAGAIRWRQGGNVGEGIRVERALLEPLRERADVRIDTTDMSASRLRRVVADKMLEPETVGQARRSRSSPYGFKHGAPREADLSFDVRFLPNPHYEPELRDLTGLRPPGGGLRERLGRRGGVLRAPACRCSTTCCRRTCARASRTSRSASAAPAAGTARW